MMKNAFYFTLKALTILQIFKCCLEFSFMSNNGLIRKIRLISKFVKKDNFFFLGIINGHDKKQTKATHYKLKLRDIFHYNEARSTAMKIPYGMHLPKT